MHPFPFPILVSVSLKVKMEKNNAISLERLLKDAMSYRNDSWE